MSPTFDTSHCAQEPYTPASAGPGSALITALHIYPVKSCRGIALDRALITATGFEHDRQWLIARPDGRFITQREEPRLALIETALRDGALHLRTPGGAALAIAFEVQGREVEVTCWRDRCAGFDEGDEAADFLSDYLGTPVRLTRFDPRGKRPSNSQWTGGIEALNQFSDGFAWLVLSEASLADLNLRLPQALPMNRFRPNIVLTGLPAYGEDRIYELSATGIRLRLVKPCARCIVTTTDQATGARDSAEPLRTLRGYRFDRELKGVTFGQNAILLDGLGKQLCVGQELAVTWGDAPQMP